MPGLKGRFFIAVLVGAAAVIGWAGWQRLAHPPLPRGVAAKPLTGDVWVAEQVEPAQLAWLSERHFRAVIDLRPDGETAGQPSSAAMAQAAAQAGLGFAYVPVPHGEIPGDQVAALQRTLAAQPRPVLLYCRSGRRAARTWALAEASREDGADAATIQRVVQAAGQSVADLIPAIQARIAARPAGHGE